MTLKALRARLDADGTASPKTRIIHHPNPEHCIGPHTPLSRPELEDVETGDRIPLLPEAPARVQEGDIVKRSGMGLVIEDSNMKTIQRTASFSAL